MGIKNTTIISKKELIKITRDANALINCKVAIALTIFFMILTLAFAILAMLFEHPAFQAFSIISVLIAGVFYLLYAYPKLLGKATTMETTDLEGNITYKYVFRENDFDIISYVKNKEFISTYKYNSLYDVKDKKYFAVIYLSKIQMYFIKYDGFTSGKEIILNKLMQYTKNKRAK